MNPEPGWYADPESPLRLRWWDGTSWTQHVSAASAAAGTPAGTAPPAASPQSSTRRAAVIASFALLAVLLVVLVLVVVTVDNHSTDDAAASSGPSAPAAADSALVERAGSADVPLLGAEGSATHTHTLLHVVVDGSPVTIPAGVGIDMRHGAIAAVHTHEAKGVIHVESPTRGDEYRVRQFLTLWGVGADEDGLCRTFASGPCTVTVRVIDPTATDRATFDRFGPMPDRAETAAAGLDTVLEQGADIEIDIDAPAAT